MAWPTVTISTTQMDAAGDDPSQARAEIKQMADNVNAIKDAKGAVSGIAELDAGGLVPTAQIPTTPVNKGGTNITAYTVGDILYASATGVLTKLAASTLGYVLTSNGTGVAPSWQLSGGGLTSGVRMLFQNSSAPTGWTKETNAAYNNVSMRLVTGSVSNGGADDFTTVFGASKTTASHTLTTAQIPSHNHPGGTGSSANSISTTISAGTGISNTGLTGGGGSHSHGLTLDLKYRDFILAQKD